MKFLCKYVMRKESGKPYYRIVFGDNLHEAMRLAERYAKKGYIVASVVEAV